MKFIVIYGCSGTSRWAWDAPYEWVGLKIASLERNTPATYNNYSNRVVFVRWAIIHYFTSGTWAHVTRGHVWHLIRWEGVVTLWNMWHLGTCDTVEHVTLRDMWHLRTCNTLKYVTMWNMWTLRTCNTLEHVTLARHLTLWNMWHLGTCDTVEHVKFFEHVTLWHMWHLGISDTWSYKQIWNHLTLRPIIHLKVCA